MNAPKPIRGEAKDIITSFRNDDEAHALLDLINAEFKSDPTSTQCFDRRIVERVALCVQRRKEYVAKYGKEGSKT